MALYYIAWFCVCFGCSMILEAINNGMLISNDVKKLKLIKSGCKGVMLLSLMAVVIFSIVTRNV